MPHRRSGWAPLDHDQRNTLNVGFDVKVPWQASVAGNVYYGSGFSSGMFDPTLVPLPPRYLAGHATLDLSVSQIVRRTILGIRQLPERHQ